MKASQIFILMPLVAIAAFSAQPVKDLTKDQVEVFALPPIVKRTLNDNFEVSRFRLLAPFAKILEIKSTEPNFLNIKEHKFDGELFYSVNEVENRVAVELNIKGFSSIANCAFPKLEIKIKKGQISIFDENKKIDLNTHCADPVQIMPNDQYAFFHSMYNAHREVVAYRILYSLGLRSFETKPVFITYTDSDTGSAPAHALKEAYQAFFIEDKSTFMKRHQYSEIFGVADPFKAFDIAQQKTVEAQYQFSSVAENFSKFDLMTLAKIELFQNLIVNSDWFIKSTSTDVRSGGSQEQLWNVKMFSDPTGQWIVVPQDFNLSLVSYIEIARIDPSFFPVSRKYISQLSSEQKNSLVGLLRSKRAEILNHLELIANDPKFAQIKELLEKRLDFLLTEI